MNTSIERLKDLQAVGNTLMALPRTNTLAFGYWDTGTLACFAGHYARNHPIGMNLSGIFGFDAMAGLSRHFGITMQETFALFASTFGEDPDQPGDAAYKELAKRLEFLRGIIARMEQNVARAARDAAIADVIPDYVRAYFAMYAPAIPTRNAMEDEIEREAVAA